MEQEQNTAPVLEKNYVSAVVYLGNEAGSAEQFLQTLCGQLSQRFENYELVFVNDASRDSTLDEVKKNLQGMQDAPPVTIINLSLQQGLEVAMNAGLDMAVGDFVWEFDSMQMPYPAEMILQAYDTCLAGSDIVMISPNKNRNVSTSLFYKLFNAASHSKYPLHTTAFRLLSRRGINRVDSISLSRPYRKAAYAASGLKMETLFYKGYAPQSTEHLRTSKAIDTLALYTKLASQASIGIAAVMLVLMVAAVVYTLFVIFGSWVEPVPGWTTTMLMLTGGFFGIFLILAVVLKYLGLLVDLVFRRQVYLVESIEKLQQ